MRKRLFFAMLFSVATLSAACSAGTSTSTVPGASPGSTTSSVGTAPVTSNITASAKSANLSGAKPSIAMPDPCIAADTCAGGGGCLDNFTCGVGTDPGGGGGQGPGGAPSSPVPSATPLVLACVGTPVQCQGIPCWQSPGTIGDILPGTNAKVTITDVNALFTGSTEDGWLYLGSDMNTYIQFNYASKASWSVGFGVFFASFGINPTGAYSSVMPFKGQWPSSSALPQKCETKGQTFQSGVQWA